MKLFGTLDGKDYTVEDFYSHAPISWELISSSAGIIITSPDDLIGAVTIERASNDPEEFYEYDSTPKYNVDTGTYEYVLYTSIKHLFYERNQFYSGSQVVTASVKSLPDNSYVVSVGQNFYGERIKPGSFVLSIDALTNEVHDDAYGNLFVSASGTGSYVGNIFYNYGIAVIAQASSSAIAAINVNGVKIVKDSQIYVDYESEVRNNRHEINVRLLPYDFNFSPFNPSIFRTYSGSVQLTSGSGPLSNIPSSSTTASYWNLYNLMYGGAVKPYVTSIGLYNDKYELLAVAKLATPIQRTFDLEQIFIVRFDT